MGPVHTSYFKILIFVEQSFTVVIIIQQNQWFCSQYHLMNFWGPAPLLIQPFV